MKLVEWTYAKTYSDAPHEYFIRQDYPEAFAKFVALIKEHGAKEKFTLRGETRWYRYYYAGGYKYWTIQNVLNRCKVAQDPAPQHTSSGSMARALRDSKTPQPPDS